MDRSTGPSRSSSPSPSPSLTPSGSAPNSYPLHTLTSKAPDHTKTLPLGTSSRSAYPFLNESASSSGSSSTSSVFGTARARSGNGRPTGSMPSSSANLRAGSDRVNASVSGSVTAGAGASGTSGSWLPSSRNKKAKARLSDGAGAGDDDIDVNGHDSTDSARNDGEIDEEYSDEDARMDRFSTRPGRMGGKSTRTRTRTRRKTEEDVEQERLLLRASGEDGEWAAEGNPYETMPKNSGLGSENGSRKSRWWKPSWSTGSDRSESTSSRTIQFGTLTEDHQTTTRAKNDKKKRKNVKSPYPANITRNQKYSTITFIPMVLYEQFKFFFNLYFLLVALSQFVPALKIGFIATYIAPLAFVLCVTMGKEAYDDYQRHLRDKEANSARYRILDRSAVAPSAMTSDSAEAGLLGTASHALLIRSIPSSKIKVGDIVLLEKNMRVPADMVLLRTSETVGTSSSIDLERQSEPSSAPEKYLSTEGPAKHEPMAHPQEEQGGSCFVRTDQLDGETDWKLRLAVGTTQKYTDANLRDMCGELYADPPIKDIHTFIGNITIHGSRISEEVPQISPLSAENMLWANTILAAGSAAGMVVYTGRETRAAMNTSEPETKVGLLDLEINWIAKILCTVTFALSVFLVGLNGFRGTWFIYIFRFLILFSSIIPISLRVNLDMGKTVYAHEIQNDPEIPGAIVRTSTLPEELGRIQYLLTDKTGTLTQNEMEMKKLHMGTMSYASDSMDEVVHQLNQALDPMPTQSNGARRQSSLTGALPVSRARRDIAARLKDAVLALATCHNVTPVINDDGSTTYQASSPDEVAIVRWTESVGLTLTNRDRTKMTIRDSYGQHHVFQILHVFPFTSESKRMGIVIRDHNTGELAFVQKGADVVMAKIVQKNDWLEEECGNMAREGLRTLVVARKRLSPEAYRLFDQQYKAAQVSLTDRAAAVDKVVSTHLEQELELLALTGVEDKLQERVKPTLELLRNAGLKIWMLTGDKIETATCIAVSSKLVSRGQYIHQVSKLKNADQVGAELDFLRTKLDCCLVIDGESLQLCLDRFKTSFIEIATELPVVVACRCSPTQKADVARLIRSYTKKRVCCIGDGGNDVSMIQAADVGVGIVGKEGKQASLAADFSIIQFSHLAKLLIWHGRNSYKRSSKLASFVIHRGLIISVIQAVYSSVFFFAPIALYQGWLQVGYATLYTMAPVFSLVLDRDVNEKTAFAFPELYQELTKGRTLSAKTFFIWLLISIYQGGVIMILSLFLFERQWLHVVAISFTALILNELIMVALEITIWHPYMIISEIVTLAIYAISMVFLPEYFDLSFVLTTQFIFKVAIIVAVSSLPLYTIKALRRRFAPAAYRKVADY